MSIDKKPPSASRSFAKKSILLPPTIAHAVPLRSYPYPPLLISSLLLPTPPMVTAACRRAPPSSCITSRGHARAFLLHCCLPRRSSLYLLCSPALLPPALYRPRGNLRTPVIAPQAPGCYVCLQARLPAASSRCGRPSPVAHLRRSHSLLDFDLRPRLAPPLAEPVLSLITVVFSRAYFIWTLPTPPRFHTFLSLSPSISILLNIAVWT